MIFAAKNIEPYLRWVFVVAFSASTLSCTPYPEQDATVFNKKTGTEENVVMIAGERVQLLKSYDVPKADGYYLDNTRSKTFENFVRLRSTLETIFENRDMERVFVQVRKAGERFFSTLGCERPSTILAWSLTTQRLGLYLWPDWHNYDLEDVDAKEEGLRTFKIRKHDLRTKPTGAHPKFLLDSSKVELVQRGGDSPVYIVKLGKSSSLHMVPLDELHKLPIVINQCEMSKRSPLGWEG